MRVKQDIVIFELLEFKAKIKSFGKLHLRSIQSLQKTNVTNVKGPSKV
jgi:hypothetical protein